MLMYYFDLKINVVENELKWESRNLISHPDSALMKQLPSLWVSVSTFVR